MAFAFARHRPASLRHHCYRRCLIGEIEARTRDDARSAAGNPKSTLSMYRDYLRTTRNTWKSQTLLHGQKTLASAESDS
jgi:hypothetical protein